VSEYENYRKRTIKEKENIYADACEDVLKNIFPVFDNLERAAVVEGSAEDIKKGIDITLKQFKDALKKLEIEEISIESGFDPHEHNAVMHVEDESVGKSQVVEVFQKGYKKGDKVLRYSMVKVAN
jgi:molecular chaperone GrpE